MQDHGVGRIPEPAPWRPHCRDGSEIINGAARCGGYRLKRRHPLHGVFRFKIRQKRCGIDHEAGARFGGRREPVNHVRSSGDPKLPSPVRGWTGKNVHAFPNDAPFACSSNRLGLTPSPFEMEGREKVVHRAYFNPLHGKMNVQISMTAA